MILEQGLCAMQLQNISIEKAAVDCTRLLEDFAREINHSGGGEYYVLQYEFQQKGERELLVAWDGVGEDRRVAGYIVYNRRPKYAMFRKLGIAELQDLIVHPDYRRQGVGRMMIKHCEDLARDEGAEHVGIGVGLDPSYGAAQQLYVRMGYVPDGNGVSYDRMPVGKGEMRPIDDDLSLLMVKGL
jgi:GNAT superfamily N-acetyltransferase